jgi:hypothetical protein
MSFPPVPSHGDLPEEEPLIDVVGGILDADISLDAPLPVTLELPPGIDLALKNLERSIFETYASTPFRADAFNLLLDLQAALHLGTTRASLVVRPKD